MVGRSGAFALVLAACTFLPQPAPSNNAPTDGRGSAAAVDARPIDAAIDAAPCGECMADGGTCNGSECDITVSGSSATCPPDMSCVIDCTGSNACNGVIDCSRATACSIECHDSGDCDGTINCKGLTSCTVECKGDSTCDNGTIEDGSGGACTIACCGNNTCNNESAVPSNCSVDNSLCN